jgi:hypothetical protein
MDDDAIQQDLLLGLEGLAPQALRRAFDALLVELAPIVARFERTPSTETMARTRDVVAALMCPERSPPGRRSKLIATDAELARSGGARGHRRSVVKSFLIDEWRKRDTRRDYEQAWAADVSAEEIRAARRRRRKKLSKEDGARRTGAPSTEPAASADIAIARQLVVRHLPSLPKIEYRVAVALELGFDVWPCRRTRRCERRAERPPPRASRRPAPWRRRCARASALSPDHEHRDLAKARDSYRKRHERGLKQLVDLIE